jgi:E3 ubiquitin-protein ligase RNF14
MADDRAPNVDMEDERVVELSSISAIFPELVLDSQDPFSASLDIAILPSTPLPVHFAAASEVTPPDHNPKAPAVPAAVPNDLHHLSYLPPLHLDITLPPGYPAQAPPSFNLSTTPQWLSEDLLRRLQADGKRLWEEFGQDQVVFAYIDHLHQSAENAFGGLDHEESLKVPSDCKIALLDFEIGAKRAAFEKETFDCGVCLGM